MEILNEKYRIAAEKSLANFGFFWGVNNDNLEYVTNLDTSNLLAVSDDGLYFTQKVNLLADNPQTMEKLFANCKYIITIHSEKEQIIEEDEEKFRVEYGDDVPVKYHPIIRSEQACYEATQSAIEIAKKHNTRLHILHLTTEAETHLFRNDIPLRDKKITTEVSVHHLWFSYQDYETLGKLIKWNPAILYGIDKRGFVREGYYADLTIVDINKPWTVEKNNILSKCGWSPLEGTTFQTQVTQTFVNGNLVYDNGTFYENPQGLPLTKTKV